MSRDLCPTCGRAGGKVERITLESLLREQRQGEIGDARHYVCMAPDCETVYYAADDSAVFGKSDLTTRFGMKEKDGPRPVCYCFDHSVESIHTEVQKTGQSTVLEDIQARMANPGCCCDRTNPLGRCCLQSVRQAVRDAIESCGVEAGSTSECAPVGCASSAPEDAPLASNRSGVLAAGGSVVAAALSSACCWLPMLLLAFGASAVGVAGFLETWRWPLVATATALLGIGFYLAYRPTRAATDCCAARGSGRRFPRSMVWTASVFVVAAALFPNFVRNSIGGLRPPAPAALADAATTELIIPVEDMTCEGCAATLEQRLASTAGLSGPRVNYERKEAHVRVAKDDEAIRREIAEAVRAAGFAAVTNRIRQVEN